MTKALLRNPVGDEQKAVTLSAAKGLYRLQERDPSFAVRRTQDDIPGFAMAAKGRRRRRGPKEISNCRAPIQRERRGPAQARVTRGSVQIENQKCHPPVVARVKIENAHGSNRRTER